MTPRHRYIRFFNEIAIEDVASVGGKNASLGEMYPIFSVTFLYSPGENDPAYIGLELGLTPRRCSPLHERR